MLPLIVGTLGAIWYPPIIFYPPAKGRRHYYYATKLIYPALAVTLNL